jgi:hypothetical protein
VEFEDTETSGIKLPTSTDVTLRLIIKCLCGRSYDPHLSKEDERLLSTLLDNAQKNGLNYTQLNELLLLLNQDKVGEDFFSFFFGNGTITFDSLIKGIAKFRGFAMLRFGNFKFAYRRLAQTREKDLRNVLFPYCKETSELQTEFEKRPGKMLEIERIPRDQTWFLGGISGEKINVEAKALEKEMAKAKKGKSQFSKRELTQLKNDLVRTAEQIKNAQKQALANTDIYLLRDYMDIYVATSMRNKWEYEETFDFLSEVFADSRLKKLNIRFFDPTQSICTNTRDKGLLEGLMLKRASCAIYLAQESDTMGKDSELAATLAQGKPVIAYVPEYNIDEYSMRIAKYPLSYFKKRLLVLDAEEILDDPDCVKKLKACDANFDRRISRFLEELEDYRAEQPFSLWLRKEEEFKVKCEDFPGICRIMAIAERHNFDRRAEILRKRHPLSMQVDLQSGVANGVLVVRNAKDCAELLHRLLTNRMKFSISHIDLGIRKESKQEGYTILEEKVSGCAFRVVTDNERLTNSFWNLFF